MAVCMSIRARPVTNEEEQGEVYAPEGNELRMRAGHAVALAVDPARSLLFDEALEEEVECLAAHLAGEHEEDLDFARREDERGVDDA